MQQLIQGENPMLMTWILCQSAGSSKLQVIENRFWVEGREKTVLFCIQYRGGLIGIDHQDALC